MTKNKIIRVVTWLLVLLLLLGGIAVIIKFANRGGNKDVGGVETDIDHIVFGDEEAEAGMPYTIGYEAHFVRESAENSNDKVTFTCRSTAKAGEAVTFTYAADCTAISGGILLCGADGRTLQTLAERGAPISGTLSFSMPAENVRITFLGLM